MIVSNFQYLLVFISALLICGALTPLMKKLASKFSIVDKPSQSHKTHIDPVPYLGGLAIMVTIWLVTFCGSLFVQIPATLIGLIGLWDDVKNLRPLPRFVAQSLGGAFTASLIVSTNTIGSPTGNNALDFFITVFWIVGVTNSVNFFDNLDGGASGTVAISSLGLFALAVTSDQFYIATLSLVLAGSAFGFLFWNRNPAQIYMGDAGALFLGMLLATLLVRFDPNPINLYAGFAIPIMIMAIPILDTSVAVISRIQRKKSPFEGGQDHLSHRLIRRNLGRKKTALILWFLTALFVALAIILSNSPYRLEGVVLITVSLIWISIFAWFYRQRHN
ncbi:MAG: undecaprenyl/decaprenyl-phosphate alpha-N-acetylglucosaminyl 1-phosphate transferase [Micrococcales bacterium]|nr:undecaprenyl/decaprenyl-phosphate alpha-N-acetylglucosaminyl 1-phosphate transferase [Micrococcales bacterium]